MALNCENLLTADIQRDCDNNPVAGIEVNVLFFNMDDINKAATTFNNSTDLLMTNFDLKQGKIGYLIEGVKSNTFGFSYELVKTEYANSYKHVFSGVIINPSVENKKSLEILSGGGKFVAIIETKWKGASNKDAFTVIGYNSGLEGGTVTYNSKENNGTIVFELSSEEGYEEPRMPYNLLITDYNTTKTAYRNKFAA